MSLTFIAAIYGVAAVVIFRRFTDAASIRRCVNRVLAHVMELGLFLDSPRLVLRAQRDLLRENLRLLRQVIVPGVILALLFLLVNLIYGRSPLPVGEAAVVTIQMKDRAMPAVQLEAPEGIVVETPGVRAVHDRQISWRVTPIRQGLGALKFRTDGRIVTPGFFLHDPAIQSIEIPYLEATMFGFSWLAGFLVISSLSAVVFGLCWKR